jgi:hypothetical protein
MTMPRKAPRKAPAPKRPARAPQAREVPQLKCPRCRAKYTIAAVFDQCDVSWPYQRWLGFECPRCHRFFHVEIEKGRVSIGGIDGAPGPAFFPDNTVDVPGLTYANKFGGISLTLGARRWSVPGKR